MHSGELQVIKYKEAMASKNRENWKNAIKEEHDRMIINIVWEPVKLSDLPNEAKLLSTTWAMKKKANGNSEQE